MHQFYWSILRKYSWPYGGALAILVLYFVANALTIALGQPPWADEVAYADPAVNLFMGQGLSSYAWPNQPAHAFWAANTPLPAWLLAGWLQIWGFGLEQVRLLNLFSHTLAAGLFWAFLYNQCKVSAAWALVALFTLLSSAAWLWTARCGRPDGLAVLCAAAGLWLHRLPANKQLLAYTIWAAVSLGMGFQLSYYLAGGLLTFRWLKGYWPTLAIKGYILGTLLALLGLLVLYMSQQVTTAFLASTLLSRHSLLGQWLQPLLVGEPISQPFPGLSQGLGLYGQDLGLVVCLMLAGGMLLVFPQLATKARWKLLCLACAVPIWMGIGGKFPFYYVWMAWLPAVWLWAEILHNAPAKLWLRLSLVCGLYGIGSWGYYRVWIPYDNRVTAPICIPVQGQTLADPRFYYVLKPLQARLWLPSYAGGKLMPIMAPKEAEQIGHLLLRAGDEAAVFQKLPGAWYVADTFSTGGAVFHCWQRDGG